MGIGAALFVFAVGAILALAVRADPNAPINLNVVGWILMFVSVVGGGMSIVYWSSWGGVSYFRRRPTTTVIPEIPETPDAHPATLQDIPPEERRRG
jgi:hypothetical protein